MADGDDNNGVLKVRPKVGAGSGVPFTAASPPEEPRGGAKLFSRIMPASYITNALVRELAIATCGAIIRDLVASLMVTMGLSAKDAAAVLDGIRMSLLGQADTDAMPSDGL